MIYTVYLKDRITGQEVCVADLCTRTEVSELRRVLEKFNACDFTVYECDFVYKKGKHE